MEFIVGCLVIYGLWQGCRILKGKADLSVKRAKMFGKKKNK